MTRLLGRSTAATYRGILRSQWSIARWALLTVVVLAGIVVALLAAFGTPEVSVVGFARQGLIWFPFSTAIAVIVGFVNVHVAMGQTRRALGRAAVLAAVTLSTVYAAGLVAVLQVERTVYAVADWEHVIMDDLSFVSDTSQVGLLFGEYLVAAAAGQLCGLLCGLTYYRYGGLRGTLALPLTVGPVVLVQAGLSADVSFLADGLAVGTAAGGLVRGALAVLVLAAVALAFQVILRTTPIRTAPVI